MRTILRGALLVLAAGSEWAAQTVFATAATAPPAPDYSLQAAWAAYPGRPSHADDSPEGVSSGPVSGVDVFFIHPTTYLTPVVGNAAFDAGGEIGARIDNGVLRFQASVFNGCCRIFAPRYRQASLRAITSNSPEGYGAADLAYSDVSNAFSRFLSVTHDRPFILAAHSQGSIHALRLLQQRIIGTPLQRRLVAAYLVGLALPSEIADMGLPICRNADATGCVISWNTVRDGHDDRRRREDAIIWWRGSYQPIAGRKLVCVNPLSWTPDGEAPASANLGAVYAAGRHAPIPAPIPDLTGARCAGDLLGVDIPFAQRHRFADLLTIAGVYHDFDYALFYMNVRSNAAARVNSWESGAR